MKKEPTFQRIHLNQPIVVAIIAVLALLLYGNSIGNKYCLDDSIVITQNSFVEKGLSGISDIFSTESFTGFFGKQKELVSGARYRPLSIASFAIEKQLFGAFNPFFSHVLNILLFIVTGVFIYLLLKRLLPVHKPVYEWVPFIAALLFIFHPIHTEVVANIKGRDEIMALLFSLMSSYFVITYLDKGGILKLVGAALLWFMALLSKENAIVFWILIPVMMLLSGIREVKKYILPVCLYSATAIVFLIIRHNVIGSSVGSSDELMNNSFLFATAEQKYATIFYTLWKYLELLFFPVQLTYDYYPYHIQLDDWSNIMSLLGLVSYVAIIIWLLLSLKKNFIIVFALLFFGLPLLLVSNLFFPIGTFMSERFLYFSSVGFCLLVSIGLSLLINKTRTWRLLTFVTIIIIFVLSATKVIARNRTWYNDYTLFTTDVKTSFNSAKSNCSAGGALLESIDTIVDPQRRLATLNQSIAYLKRSVTIHPKYFDAWLLLGNAYFKKDIGADSVFLCYSTILNLIPTHELAFQNMNALVNREKNVDTKIYLLNSLLSYQPNNYQVNYDLGKLYGRDKGDLDKSITYLTKAMSINPDGKEVYIDLGVAYGLKRNFEKSAEMLRVAVDKDPNDANVIINLGVTYQNLGETAKAKECFRKAGAIKKSTINN